MILYCGDEFIPSVNLSHAICLAWNLCYTQKLLGAHGENDIIHAGGVRRIPLLLEKLCDKCKGIIYFKWDIRVKFDGNACGWENSAK